MPKVIFFILLIYVCGASWGSELKVEILRDGAGAVVRLKDTDAPGIRLQTARSLEATDIDHLAFDGDSIVAGNNVPGAEYWRAVAQSLGGGCTNVAFSGATGAQLLERFTDKVAPLFWPKSVLVFGAGVDHLTQGATVAEESAHCWVLAGELRPGPTAGLPLALSITNGMRFFRSATVTP